MSAPEINLISVIIPVLNEAESLPTLHQEITAVASQLPAPIEIWFIDDGSQDRSWEIICELRASDPRVCGLRFRRNFGKAAALAAGFEAAQGELLFTLDADLQDNPAEMPLFLQRLAEGFDLVSGWKRIRHDPWHKTLPSRVFNRMVSWLTGVHLHDHNCGFKCYRREVVQELRLYGEFHRFTPVLAAARGFAIAEIPVRHRPRKFGQSKYGFNRFLRGLLDMLTIKFLTDYQNRPQHLIGMLGFFLVSVGSIGLVYLVLHWIYNQTLQANPEPIGTRPLLTYSMTLLLFGTQLLSLGLIAELVAARNLPAHDIFSIRDTLPPPTLSTLTTDSPEPANPG